MGDSEQSDEVAELGDEIEEMKSRNAPKPHAEEHYSQAQLAWRMVIELVAGLAIGFGAGYGLDVLIGTMPVFLVLFTLLGFAAGVRTMMRSAREVQAQMQEAARGRAGKDGGSADGD